MFVTRFAPSPTGHLHLGHALAAFQAFDAAEKASGTCLLRIEDIDQGRCKPEFEAAIHEDLAWLGLHWPQPVRRQSAHKEDYAGALALLIDKGLVYRCFKTRAELVHDSARAPHGPSDNAPAPDLGQAQATEGPFAWRLSVQACQRHLGPRWSDLGAEMDGVRTPLDPAQVQDPIIARKDFPTSYHLASVWDDALQGVTHIIRGEDLMSSAHVHLVLQAVLDLPTPIYRHHALILDETGRRLAKRDAAKTLRAMRDAGHTPRDIRVHLGLPA